VGRWHQRLPTGYENLDADDFNSDKMWTFMETAKFAKGCTDGAVVAAAQVPVLLAQTTIVREFVFVDGIPRFRASFLDHRTFVEIDIVIAPWSPIFITTIIKEWIFVWNTVNINVACAPSAIKPIKSTPPLLPLPTPPQKRADNPPTFIRRPSRLRDRKSHSSRRRSRARPCPDHKRHSSAADVRPLHSDRKRHSIRRRSSGRFRPSAKTFVPHITRTISQQPNSVRTLATVGSGQRASFRPRPFAGSPHVKRDFERGPRRRGAPAAPSHLCGSPMGASVLKANARSPMSPTSSRRNSKRRKLLEAKAAGSSGARAGCCTRNFVPAVSLTIGEPRGRSVSSLSFARLQVAVLTHPDLFDPTRFLPGAGENNRYPICRSAPVRATHGGSDELTQSVYSFEAVQGT